MRNEDTLVHPGDEIYDTMPTAMQTILRSCQKNCDKEVYETSPKTVRENPTRWTIVDLFLRQYLNNLCDGFGLYHVAKVYQYMCKHKQVLIKYDLISKSAVNNAGSMLWEKYDFVRGNRCREQITMMSDLLNKLQQKVDCDP